MRPSVISNLFSIAKAVSDDTRSVLACVAGIVLAPVAIGLGAWLVCAGIALVDPPSKHCYRTHAFSGAQGR